MNVIELYNDFSVPYATEGHKHCRPGWVNTECPFCTGNPGLHLGYDLRNNRYACWRCGWHPVTQAIAKLLRIRETEAKTIVQQYGGVAHVQTKEPTVRIRAKAHRLPSNTGPLQENHVRYLQSRGFDAEYLEREWNLVGTGPVSRLDKIDYKHRIVLPFIWNNQQVSFDSRDITNKTKTKYMACPLDRELIPHKEILYGRQSAWHDTVVAVEGPTDVWRFGFDAVATSGIKFTPKQVRLLAKFKRVPVCFDGGEPQAIAQANRLVAELRFRGVDSFRVDIVGDPGSMKQSEADYLMKQLIK